MAQDAAEYPVKIEIELTSWDNLGSFLAFLRYVRAAANAGHGFSIEADREEGSMPELMRKFGLKGEWPRVYVDGDGADHVGRITVNGDDLR